MWLLCAFLTFISWGIADLFYKIGNKSNDKYNHLKTGLIVGLIMGIHATFYLLLNSVKIEFIDILKYLPVSLCYIASMVIGYKGLKYLELSIASPIQNTSGVITALLLLIFFKEKLSVYCYIAFFLIFVGIFILSKIELNNSKTAREEFNKRNTFGNILKLTIIFPLTYCLIDGMGTFLDAIYLDYGQIINEDTALIAYEYTFLVYSFITYIYLNIKGEKLNLFKEKTKIFAALFETLGQFFYVFAMAGFSVIAAPIVGSYCILSMILSRIFLKEILTKKEYFAIFLVLMGILILGILDI